jgi:hypothetical protein
MASADTPPPWERGYFSIFKPLACCLKVIQFYDYPLVPRAGGDPGWAAGEPLGEPEKGHRPPVQAGQCPNVPR